MALEYSVFGLEECRNSIHGIFKNKFVDLRLLFSLKQKEGQNESSSHMERSEVKL